MYARNRVKADVSYHFVRQTLGFLPTFWLNENVGFHPTFSRQGITRINSVLLLWLNEKVGSCAQLQENNT